MEEVKTNLKVEDGIPMEKLLNNLKKELETNKELIVLISTGAYNPVHNMHIQVMETTKKHLEEQDSNCAVIAGFLSPSHDHYVYCKLRNQAINAVHRVKMIEHATQGSTWISASSYESELKGFVDFPEVCSDMQRIITQRVSQEVSPKAASRIKDLACKCGLFCGSNVDWCAGVIAVGRPGDSLGTPQLKKLMSRTPSRDLAKDFVLIDTDTEDISSTLVRQKLKAGEPIDDLVPPEVVQYIQNNDIKLIPPKSDWSVYQ